MTSILTIITIAIRLWPFILSGVKEAEAAFPLPKSGADKLNAVLAGIEVAYEVASPLQGLPKDQVILLAAKLATKAVASANAVGDFKPATATPVKAESI